MAWTQMTRRSTNSAEAPTTDARDQDVDTHVAKQDSK
eukprot:CAMPEP_0177530482 /NCGR_PEP_ID=MMETSP0369-20130122/53433_1 /TAXON_ID=447022 ORGANISM="Scrippsiella hangoei-like, Strain SHHI-4" /NCGR_SAMPLE_ID=MMETSP0369 /ASSEMBLY_ACC=CAM_ASM_000364 /LENGTH=36 /DNA_ID= /DNA_START= /DNA_END= /DNA_ORIENTATION=